MSKEIQFFVSKKDKYSSERQSKQCETRVHDVII